VVEDQSLQIARRAAGDVSQGLCEMSQIAVFTSNANRAGYDGKHWWPADSSQCMFAFNLNHKDPIKRRVYNDLTFRQALSYSINHRRINETLYFWPGKGMAGDDQPQGVFFLSLNGSSIALDTTNMKPIDCLMKQAWPGTNSDAYGLVQMASALCPSLFTTSRFHPDYRLCIPTRETGNLSFS